MYYEMATRLMLLGAASPQHSQAILIRGNSIELDMQVIFASSTDGITVQLQIGNDLENWENVTGASITLFDIGADLSRVAGIAAKYARLEYVNDGDSAAVGVIAAGMRTTTL